MHTEFESQTLTPPRDFIGVVIKGITSECVGEVERWKAKHNIAAPTHVVDQIMVMHLSYDVAQRASATIRDDVPNLYRARFSNLGDTHRDLIVTGIKHHEFEKKLQAPSGLYVPISSKPFCNTPPMRTLAALREERQRNIPIRPLAECEAENARRFSQG